MKKIFFAVATAIVALFGLNSCEETVSKDVTASAIANFEASGVDAITYKCAIEDMFMDEFVAAGGQKMTQGTALFSAQSSEKTISETVKNAAEKADKAVKEKYGDGTTVAVPSNFTSLEIVVSYHWDSDKTIATYTYK